MDGVLTNQPHQAHLPPTDDEVLRLFVMGQGYGAFRTYVREVRDNGWSRPEIRFIVDALYARLGVIVRNNPHVDDFTSFLQVLKEVLSECIAGPSDLRTRVSGLSDFVTDLINQEGGPNSIRILSDQSALRIVRHLSGAEHGDESSLMALFSDVAEFNQAILSLVVSGLVALNNDDESLSYRLTDTGRYRLASLLNPDPFEGLSNYPDDITLWTYVIPIFDMLILPFAQSIMSEPARFGASRSAELQRYFIGIKCRPLERPLTDWLTLDELVLNGQSSKPTDVGAITVPKARASRTVEERSMDLSVGDSFVGFHLLVANSALEELNEKVPRFPDSAEELKSAIEWPRFGLWLAGKNLEARIFADAAVRPALEMCLECCPEASQRVRFIDAESNTERLNHLGVPTLEAGDGPRIIQLAACTGPLLAMAESANVSILTTSFSMLNEAVKKGIDYDRLSALMLKQYVHVGISKSSFEESMNEKSWIREDRVHRISSFIRAIYHIIKSEPDLFADYCVEQWGKLRDIFPDWEEFKRPLRLRDVKLAIESSYRWLGHDLAHLSAPKDRTGFPELIRESSFWSDLELVDCYWPKVESRRRELEDRIANLQEVALGLIGKSRRDERAKLVELVSTLTKLGSLRRAESGLQTAIEILEARANAN